MLVLLNLHFPYCKGLGGFFFSQLFLIINRVSSLKNKTKPQKPCCVEFRGGASQEIRHTQIHPSDQQMNTHLSSISTVEDIVSQMMK